MKTKLFKRLLTLVVIATITVPSTANAATLANITDPNAASTVDYKFTSSVSHGIAGIKTLDNIDITRTFAFVAPAVAQALAVASETSIAKDNYLNFDSLHKTNPDIYAWIKFPACNIDYPILQSAQDNYYLRKDMAGQYSVPGCIYTNASCNTKTFNDPYTIMYGHNMHDGTMFAGLHNLDNGKWMSNPPTFTIETEDKIMSYVVVGTVDYSDAYVPAYFSTLNAASRDSFIQSCYGYTGRSITHLPEKAPTFGATEPMVVLSTCILKEENNRFLVLCKMTGVVNK